MTSTQGFTDLVRRTDPSEEAYAMLDLLRIDERIPRFSATKGRFQVLSALILLANADAKLKYDGRQEAFNTFINILSNFDFVRFDAQDYIYTTRAFTRLMAVAGAMV